MYRLILAYIILSIVGCYDSGIQAELRKAKDELASAQSTIRDLESQIETEGDLVHLIFLKVRSDVDESTLIGELNKLSSIEGVHDFQSGAFMDLGDTRALSEYNWLIEMSFRDSIAYRSYQSNSIHLNVRDRLKTYLAGPPASYDYRKK